MIQFLGMIDWNSLGALHLVILHLPIGLFVGVLALELALSREKYEEAHNKALGVLLPLTLLSALLTVRLGYALGETVYDWDAIADHRIASYYFLGALAMALFSFWWTRWRSNIWSGGVYAVSLASALVALILTGHYGGVITHGEYALDEAIPALFRKSESAQTSVIESSPQTNATPANPYTTDAYAILEAHCIECHGINKRKGGYRLDVPRLAKAGGDSHKPGIVPGKPDASEVVIRAILPRGTEGAMPPGKKPALTAEQIDVLRSWIEAGAQFPGEESNQPAKLDIQTVKQIEALRELGAAADFTPWSDEYVLVNLSQMESPDWKLCATKLSPLTAKLAWLNAGDQQWPPEFYDQLKSYSHLQRLHLEHSNVTDADLTKITPLKELLYLNLTGTSITANGLKTVLTMPTLTEVYIHGTDIPTKELKQLRQQFPNVEIIGQSAQSFPK